MNWKEEAKEKLRKYDAMKAATINIPEEIKRLEREFTAIRSARADAAPIRGGTSAREDAIINNIDKRQELNAALQNAVTWVKSVDRALESISSEERTILHRIYICQERGAIERLCNDLGYGSSSIYRRRDRALKTFTIALYGVHGDEIQKD